jgi:hypothetical protein
MSIALHPGMPKAGGGSWPADERWSADVPEMSLDWAGSSVKQVSAADFCSGGAGLSVQRTGIGGSCTLGCDGTLCTCCTRCGACACENAHWDGTYREAVCGMRWETLALPR